jgi:hypothetical protein
VKAFLWQCGDVMERHVPEAVRVDGCPLVNRVVGIDVELVFDDPGNSVDFIGEVGDHAQTDDVGYVAQRGVGRLRAADLLLELVPLLDPGCDRVHPQPVGLDQVFQLPLELLRQAFVQLEVGVVLAQ